MPSSPLRLAYFSPLPPDRSGIADYSWELLPHLAERCALTVFAVNDATVAPAGFDLRPAAGYPAARLDFDLTLYHMGNSLYHDDIYRLLTRYPGVVVLHDFYLHQLMAERTTGRGDFPAYAREMGYARGVPGYRLARRIRDGRAPSPLYEEPLNARLIDSSLGLVVHSAFAANGVRRRRPDAPVAVVPQPIAGYPARSLRETLGLPASAVVFAVLGQVTAVKQVPVVLKALATLRESIPDIHLLVVGEVLPEVALDRAIADLGMEEAVTQAGYAPTLQAFADYIATADVVINLRLPTLGETSAAALRALDLGRPLVVYNHGWYAEIPDGAAIKVEPGDEAALLAALSDLARSPALRQQLGAAARAYVASTCRPAAVADAYIAFLGSLAASIRERYR
jgi:glycosyltransferase involved in cell wall biosynthesis